MGCWIYDGVASGVVPQSPFPDELLEEGDGCVLAPPLEVTLDRAGGWELAVGALVSHAEAEDIPLSAGGQEVDGVHFHDFG